MGGIGRVADFEVGGEFGGVSGGKGTGGISDMTSGFIGPSVSSVRS